MLGIVGIIGLVCGGPAILHHLLVSTAPHERMGFLIEGAFAIAVLTALARSALGFRTGAGFGMPLAAVDRSPTIGQPLELNVSVPTRYSGTARLNARLKCEAKDTRLFNISEENPDTVLLDQHTLLADSQPVTKGGELARSADLIIPDHLPPPQSISGKESTRSGA